MPRTVPGWIALFFLGIPAWLLIERMGKLILHSKFFGNLNSTARILLGVPTMIILIGGAYTIVLLVQFTIDLVGG